MDLLVATQRGSLRQVSNLLRGSYGESGVMDFGLYGVDRDKRDYIVVMWPIAYVINQLNTFKMNNVLV